MIKEMRCRNIKTGTTYKAKDHSYGGLISIEIKKGRIKVLNREEFNEQYRYTATGESIKQAPWPDEFGYKMHAGDVISPPDSPKKKVVYDDKFDDPWRLENMNGGNSIPLIIELNKGDVDVIVESTIRYTEAQRAAGMHKFNYKSKPKQFTHRTLRGG